MKEKFRLIYLASGTGQLFESCASYFQKNRPQLVENAALLTDCPDGPLLFRAERLGVSLHSLFPKKLSFAEELSAQLKELHPDLILLVGFKYKIPDTVVRAFKGRIINSHPSLLPLFGGPGMYGRKVHEAVFFAGAKQSGFTLHEVIEEIDKGPILLQKTVDVSGAQSSEEVEEIVKAFERVELPKAIEELIELKISSQRSIK